MQNAKPALDSRPRADDADRIVHRLEQIRRIIDDKFVAAGEILLKSLNGIDDLIQSLDRFAKTFDEKIVASIKADLIVAAAKLCTLPACHARYVEHIGQLSRSRAKLGRHVAAMRCHLALMAAFSRNAKVMADATPGAGFGAIADRIATCVTDSCSELAAVESELTALQRNLESAATKGEVLGRRIAALLPAVPDDLEAAARIVGGHYAAVAATAEQVSLIARDIQGRVVRFLAAIQFGDITRQRIEHVLACLIRTRADAAFTPPEVRHRFRATCHALIALQLAEISADFARESTEIEIAMRKLAADARMLLNLHDITFDRDDGRSSGFLHTLATRIDAAMKLVAKIEAADNSAIDTGRTTIETARTLGQRIDRIQALRTDLQAMTTETSGTLSLGAVTGEIRENSRLLEEAAKVGLATLDKLLQLADAVSGMDDCPRPQDSRAAAAAAALTIAAQRIRDARDTTETDIAEVAAQGDAVIHMLSLSGARLSLRSEIADVLAFAATEATRLSEDAYGVTDDIPDSLVETLANFSDTYTMAPERALHQTFLTTLAIAAADAEPVSLFDESDTVLF